MADFKVGKRYLYQIKGERTVIEIMEESGLSGHKNYKFKCIEGNRSCLDFDECSLFADELTPFEDLPRICYILGGEDNPLKIGEKFTFSGFTAWIDKFGYINCNDVSINVPTICGLINGTEITRQPQFSEDEKALMRLHVAAGYQWIVRTDRWLYACKNKPTILSYGINTNGESQYIAPELLPQILEHEPFNSADYLEGLK